MNPAVALPARFWREYRREGVALAILGIAGAAALAGAAWSSPALNGLAGPSSAAAAVPPAPPPLLVREIAPQDAVAVNQGIPIDAGPNPAAKPFVMGTADEGTRARAVECLTSAIYYEAGQESADGQRAVAQVVLNRVRHPAFPASVCGVVYEGSTRATGCQFTFTCDGSLARRPGSEGWARARSIAEAAIAGAVFAPVGNATHYHANYVVPYWASSLAKSAVVGAHIFYRWAGGWGRPAAFAQRYVQREPNAQALRLAAVEAARDSETLESVAAEVPGAEKLPLTPSMRGDKRVAVRFNLAARKAAEEAPRRPYVERVEASKNLRWSLTGGGVDTAEQKPLGRPEPTPSAGGGVSGAAPE